VLCIFDFIVVRNSLLGSSAVIVLMRNLCHGIGVLGSLLVICTGNCYIVFCQDIFKIWLMNQNGIPHWSEIKNYLYSGIIRAQLGVANVMTEFYNSGYCRQCMSQFSE
jgi:hypothetical protein